MTSRITPPAERGNSLLRDRRGGGLFVAPADSSANGGSLLEQDMDVFGPNSNGPRKRPSSADSPLIQADEVCSFPSLLTSLLRLKRSKMNANSLFPIYSFV